MMRSSVLYRRLWYAKRRNAKRIHIYLRMLYIVIILVLLLSYTQKKLLPYAVEISQYRTKAIVTGMINTAVKECYDDKIGYRRLVMLSKDNDGRITSIQTNVAEMNRISASISQHIQENLSDLKRQTITLPLGTLTGISIFSDLGPALNVRMQPLGTVQTEFKSEFTSQGINQTKHSIYLQVKTGVGIVIPLLEKKIEITSKIPVAETVIVGSVPESYIGNGSE